MNRKIIFKQILALVLMLPVSLMADEILPGESDPPTENEAPAPADLISRVAPVLDTTDLSDPDLPVPVVNQSHDLAEVISPGLANSEGSLQIANDSNTHANISRSGQVVERVPLVDNGSGCLIGKGQIGQVSICSSGTSLLLTGQPSFSCPSVSSTVFGPCQLQES
jgi:hypothetical protein